jgi:signal transduction histidine kinase/ligand-binding sensor domain-containing protein
MQRSILIACLFLYNDCFSQQYPFVHYTPREGLVNNRARFVFQDSKGKLYIATYGGLSVYDGSRFTNYNTNNGLAVDLVNDIVEMGDDSIWIMPNDHKVYCLVKGKIKNFITADNFTPLINQLLKSSDGHYYAFCDEGLFRLEKNRFVKIDLTNSFYARTINTLLQGAEIDNKLYVLANPDYNSVPQSLLVYDLSKRKVIAYDTTVKVMGFFPFPPHELWIWWKNALYTLDKDKVKDNPTALKLVPDSFHMPKDPFPNVIFRDRQNNTWLAGARGIYHILKNGETTLFTVNNGLTTNIQTSIFQDFENNMWFTNEETGLCKLSNPQLAYYPQFKADFIITDIFAQPSSDSVWMQDGYHHSMMVVLPGGRTQEYTHTGEVQPCPGRFISANERWITCGTSIFRWKEIPNTGHYILGRCYQDTINNMGVSCAVADRHGNLVAVGNKVVVIAGDKAFSQPINYLADQVTVDKENRIWTAHRGNELFCFQLTGSGNNQKLELLRKFTRPMTGSPRSITADQTGHIWVGTRDQGLYCFYFRGLTLDSIHQLTTLSGLTSNFVSSLFCDRDNNIWACSPTGVDKITASGNHFQVENITKASNLYLPIDKVQQASTGVIWILSRSGIITYDPSRSPTRNWRPHLALSEKVLSNDAQIQIPPNRELKYFQNNLSFQLSAPTFVDEKQTRFSYLLQGSRNETWSVPSTDAAINLVNLPPGDYTLKAKAIFVHGLYPEIESSVSFVILPPWWETWWFKVSIGTFILGLLLLALRFYINRKLALQRVTLEKRRAIEKERTRIATDMHDDLGAGLSQIKFLSEAIGMKKQKHLPIEEEITSIRTFSVEMIDKMGEIVWALNEKNDTLSDLLSYTRSYAVAYLEQNGLTCHFEEPDDIPQDYVSSEFRRNIYLTVKESLHNIVKHAQATQVIIDVQITDCLAIQIKDNGVGFDSTRQNSFGNGLVSMNARIRELKGRFEIINNNGTEVSILVPLN